MLGIIEETRTTTSGPTAQDWARYVELLTLERPTVGQKREFVELLGKLDRTPAQAEVDQVVLQEAAKLEELIRGEAEATAEDQAAFRAESAARQALLDEICKLQRRFQQNDFEECRTYNATRERCQEMMHARGELSTLYARWPGLFNLPVTEKPHTGGTLPDAVGAKMSQLGIPLYS